MYFPDAKPRPYSPFWVGAILLLSVFLTEGCTVKMTEDDLRQRIHSELPAGSSLSQVTHFLDRNKIGHTTYSDEKPSSSFYNLVPEDKKEKIKGSIGASVPKSEKSILWSTGLYMEFYFDHEKKLVTYSLIKMTD